MLQAERFQASVSSRVPVQAALVQKFLLAHRALIIDILGVGAMVQNETAPVEVLLPTKLAAELWGLVMHGATMFLQPLPRSACKSAKCRTGLQVASLRGSAYGS